MFKPHRRLFLLFLLALSSLYSVKVGILVKETLNEDKVVRQEKFCPVGKLELWTESFGNPGDPAVLLIMGAMNQGILWPDELCEKLAESGHFVLRYDHRDVGRSSCTNFIKDPYDINTLAQDALAVLDGYGIDSAHIVGLSMGGVIGEVLALDYAARVQSLTLMMTTPDLSIFMDSVMGKGSATRSSLPPPSKEVVAYFKKKFRTKGENEEEKINLVLEGWQLCNGALPFRQEEMFALQQKIRERSHNLKASFNHGLALMMSDLKYTKRLKEIKIPTLVIHGEQDPCFPPEHGAALSDTIQNSQLVLIEDMGHILAPELSTKINFFIQHHIDKRK